MLPVLTVLEGYVLFMSIALLEVKKKLIAEIYTFFHLM